MFKRIMKKGGDVEIDVLIWWIIAFVVIVILIIGYIILSGKGSGMIEQIRNLFRFGGSGS